MIDFSPTNCIFNEQLRKKFRLSHLQKKIDIVHVCEPTPTFMGKASFSQEAIA